MPTTLTIELPDDLRARLEHQAEANHRSLDAFSDTAASPTDVLAAHDGWGSGRKRIGLDQLVVPSNEARRVEAGLKAVGPDLATVAEGEDANLRVGRIRR